MVLRLHARAHAAPQDVGAQVEQLRERVDLVAAGQAGGDGADAGKVLHRDHGADDAAVALGRLDGCLVVYLRLFVLGFVVVCFGCFCVVCGLCFGRVLGF